MEVDEGLFSFFVDEFTKLRDEVIKAASEIQKICRDQQAIRTDMTSMRLALDWGETDDMLTAHQVAQELGIEYKSVLKLIRHGKIGARRSNKHSSNYAITRAECERYKATRHSDPRLRNLNGSQ